MKFARYFSFAVVSAAIALGTGCAAKVDRITIDKIIGAGMEHQDMDRLCSVGEALGIPMGGIGLTKNATKAQVMADISAALCLEPMVREAQLDGAFARKNLEGEAKIAAVMDARYREERAHTAAAYRYKRAWDNLEKEYGPVGGECPKIKEKDELVYLMGLYGGIHGMLHDQAGGGHVGVSFDTLGKVARGTACLDNERWWHVPGSFKFAAYATLLNEEEGDPWEALAAEAAAGEKQGIRLARAVHVMILANADRTEDLRGALADHAASMADTPVDPAWLAMDQYAYEVSRHELDRLWVAESGHRAPAFDELPGEEEETDSDTLGSDPFGGGGSPFGDDGASPFGDDGSEEEGSDDEDSTDPGDEQAGEE